MDRGRGLGRRHLFGRLEGGVVFVDEDGAGQFLGRGDGAAERPARAGGAGGLGTRPAVAHFMFVQALHALTLPSSGEDEQARQ